VAITFSIPTTEIIVTSGQTTATCQEIYDAARVFEEQFVMMGYDHIVDAGGKLPIDKAGGVFTEIVMSLRDPWTIRFEDEDTAHCAVRGGTLLAFDGVGDPRPVSTNFGLTINQSVSGVLVDSGGTSDALLSAVNRNADLIESQRGHHTHQGNEYFYVDPVNGDTIANGATGMRDSPLNTVTEAHSLVTDSAHSIIFLIAGAAAGPTTLVEDVILTKRYTFIRGPGRDFIWTSTGNVDTIQVLNSEGIYLSGFQLESDAAFNGAGLRITSSPFVHAHHLWVNETGNSGIEIENSDHVIVQRCTVNGAGQGGAGHGIQVSPALGTSKHVRIIQNHVGEVPGNGIFLNGANVDNCTVAENEVHRCTGWGIRLVGTKNAFVRDNWLGENAAGDFSDGGQNTVYFDPARGADTSLSRKLLNNRQEVSDGASKNLVTYDDDDVTVLVEADMTDVAGGPITNAPGAPARRSRGV
jgi:hypothetical protein